MQLESFAPAGVVVVSSSSLPELEPLELVPESSEPPELEPLELEPPELEPLESEPLELLLPPPAPPSGRPARKCPGWEWPRSRHAPCP